MRCLLLPACAPLLAACGGPAYTGLHGHTSLTLTEAAEGGEGVPRAGPVNAKVCRWTDRELGTHVTLRLGPACVLDSDWAPRAVWAGKVAVPAGGAGGIAAGQPCVLSLGETKTALVVQGGTITQATRDGPSTRPSEASRPRTAPATSPSTSRARLTSRAAARGATAWRTRSSRSRPCGRDSQRARRR